jgi:nucleotide-binding universal stress UspA family protein
MTKILALVDGSIYAASVCDLAAWAAGRMAMGVELLHVLGRRDASSAPADLSGSLKADGRDALLSELAALDEQKAKLNLRRGRLLLDEAKTRVQKAQDSAEVSIKLRHGDLLDTLAEFETDAALVIVGKRGEAADFAKGHLGSNLERIVRSSRKPVLVAARAFRPIKRFLVAYDGGPSADKAVDMISRGSLLRGLACDLLTVGTPGGEAETKLQSAAGRLRGGGYAVRAIVHPGEPEAVILGRVEAEGIDLLVMGAYGHSRIRNLVVGSTTATMVQRCKVPVLMIR